MTEDTSPENLRKFLESDDSAMIRMGLSMAKINGYDGASNVLADTGWGTTAEMLGEILWMYMLHDDKTIRAAAKSTFMKIAPEDTKQAVKDNWKANYREAVNSGNPKNVVLVELAVKPFSVSLVEPLIRTLEDEKWDSYFGTDYNRRKETQSYSRRRAGIASILGDIGDKRAVEPLIKALDKKLLVKDIPRRRFDFVTEYYQPWHREVAEALGKIGDMRAVEPLIKMLKTALSLYRESAARALDELKWKPDTKEHLATYLIAKGHPRTHGDCINNKKLVELGEPAVEPLIRALKQYLESGQSDAWWIGEAIVKALGDIGDTRAVGPLIKALDSSAHKISETAAEALVKIGAVEQLIERLGDEKKGWAQYYVAKALGNSGDVRAVEPLIKTLKDENEKELPFYYLCEAIAEALGKIVPLQTEGMFEEKVLEVLIKSFKDTLDDENLSTHAQLRGHWKNIIIITATAIVKIKTNIKGKEKQNIIKFLESNDPGMVRMGASMLKGILEK